VINTTMTASTALPGLLAMLASQQYQIACIQLRGGNIRIEANFPAEQFFALDVYMEQVTLMRAELLLRVDREPTVAAMKAIVDAGGRDITTTHEPGTRLQVMLTADDGKPKPLLLTGGVLAAQAPQLVSMLRTLAPVAEVDSADQPTNRYELVRGLFDHDHVRAATAGAAA
jgi:hypothetical protein